MKQVASEESIVPEIARRYDVFVENKKCVCSGNIERTNKIHFSECSFYHSQVYQSLALVVLHVLSVSEMLKNEDKLDAKGFNLELLEILNKAVLQHIAEKLGVEK